MLDEGVPGDVVELALPGFAAGEGRERAFALQLRRRAASLVPPVPPPVVASTPPPRRRRQAADDDAERTQCGLTCFGSAYVCA